MSVRIWRDISTRHIEQVSELIMRPTIFTLLHFMTIFFVGHVGSEFGSKWLGPHGGIVGALVGGAIGLFIGCVMSIATNWLTVWFYRRKSSVKLRLNLNEAGIDSTYISSLIIFILLDRGDSVESFRDYVFRQLNSDDICQRRAGLVNLGLCYPVHATKLAGFNPFAPTKDDLERLNDVESLCALNPNTEISDR